MSDFEFIDAHVHFYDLGHPTLSYAWLQPEFVHPVIGNIDAIKTYRYRLGNYEAETRFAGVIGAVHVKAALGNADPAQESEFVNSQLSHDTTLTSPNRRAYSPCANRCPRRTSPCSTVGDPCVLGHRRTELATAVA